MRSFLKAPLVASFLLLSSFAANAQLDKLFSSYDCREHAEFFHVVEAAAPIIVDTVKTEKAPELTVVVDTTDGWKDWSYVQNFTFGKDRGPLPMITDLSALHPFFRDKIIMLIEACHEQGIELAVVESYRTHAKQHEYKTMGRKYTSSGAGKSKHQYGLAVDVVPVVDSVAVWDNVALWKKIGVTGEKLGLRWGGRWRKPYDPGHFEWTGGLTSTHLAQGLLPMISDEHYPCVHEDIRILRRYWKEWETAQSAITRK